MDLENEAESCRICLSNDSTGNMISPCDCTGSMKKVHRKCLNQWQKVKNLNGHCEICGYNFTRERIGFVGFRKSWNRIISNLKEENNYVIYFFYIMIIIK